MAEYGPFPPPGEAPITDKMVSAAWRQWFNEFKRILTDGLEVSRLVATNAKRELVDVDDLTSWFTTANGITTNDNGDGTMEIGQNTPDQGNLWCHSAADPLVSAAQNDWDQITSFTTQGNLTVGVDVSVANSDITIGSGGTQMFLVWFNTSCYCATDHEWEVQVKKNNGATGITSISSHFNTSTANRRYGAHAANIVAVQADDTIELWVKRLSAGNNITLTIDNAVLGVMCTQNA